MTYSSHQIKDYDAGFSTSQRGFAFYPEAMPNSSYPHATTSRLPTTSYSVGGLSFLTLMLRIQRGAVALSSNLRTNDSRRMTNDKLMFFHFEADFVNNLRCIPMQVRYKLDTCGVKLKLHHWHQFNQSEREALVDQLCETPDQIRAYQEKLQNLVIEYTGEPAKELEINPHPPWFNLQKIPQQLEEKAREFGIQITLKQWQRLTPLQRFALIKLSRPSHENKNFYPALKEFRVVE